MDQQVKIDSDAVRSLAELLRETDLTEIEYQIDSLRIKVSRTVHQVMVSASQQPVIQEPVSAAASVPPAPVNTRHDNLLDHPGVIEAQMVGTVYLSPGPDAPPFVSVGDKVSQGQTLFIIEAMKVMNMIKAPRSGIVRHIFVKDTQPVEYGDPVIIID